MIRGGGGSRFARPIRPPDLVILEKWFPLQGERAHSLNFFFFFCMYVNRKEEEEGETKQLQSY